MLAAIDASSLTDTDRATLVFVRGSTVIWALNEPTRAKKLADDASHTIAPACRSVSMPCTPSTGLPPASRKRQRGRRKTLLWSSFPGLWGQRCPGRWFCLPERPVAPLTP